MLRPTHSFYLSLYYLRSAVRNPLFRFATSGLKTAALGGAVLGRVLVVAGFMGVRVLWRGAALWGATQRAQRGPRAWWGVVGRGGAWCGAAWRGGARRGGAGGPRHTVCVLPALSHPASSASSQLRSAYCRLLRSRKLLTRSKPSP